MTQPTAKRWPLSYHLYRFVTFCAAPLLHRFAGKRHRAMGCAADRLGERFGHASLPRPQGSLVWINAASMGELRATIAVATAMPDAQLLITTTSQSGAEMVSRQFPPNCMHQFAPLDTGAAAARFLDYWRPDLALFVESDLPLRVIDRLARAGVRMGILNARPSRTRNRFPGLSAAVLSRMALATSQDQDTAAQLIGLGLPEQRHVMVTDLKTLAPPPRPDPQAVAALRNQISGRPVWLAMSAHPEEVEQLLAAHRRLLRDRPDLLLLLAPRHPDAMPRFEGVLNGLTARRRSRGEEIGDAQVYFADTLGEAGTLFAVAPFAVICGTFADLGGHSPAEALAAGLPVLRGPHVGNHAAAFERAEKCGAARVASDTQALASAVADWLSGDALETAASAARTAGARNDTQITALVSRIEQLMP